MEFARSAGVLWGVNKMVQLKTMDDLLLTPSDRETIKQEAIKHIKELYKNYDLHYEHHSVCHYCKDGDDL